MAFLFPTVVFSIAKREDTGALERRLGCDDFLLQGGDGHDDFKKQNPAGTVPEWPDFVKAEPGFQG